MFAPDTGQPGWSPSGLSRRPRIGSMPRTRKKSPLTRMPFALRTSPPVARLNRSSDHTAISANPSWRLRICSHMAKVSWEYWLENWPEPQWRSAIRMVPSSWGFLTGMVRRRMESMSWKMAVLAPIPRASVRTATRVKPGLRRRNRKAWRRSRQSEVIASPWQYQTMGGLECHGVTEKKVARQLMFGAGRGGEATRFPGKERPPIRLSRGSPPRPGRVNRRRALHRRVRGLGLRQGLAREHFVAIGGQVDEGSHDHGHLLHIRLLDAFVDVHVGVMGTRVVVQGVLDELKTGEADGIEGQVIGAAGVADSECIHAEVVERNHPCGEDGRHH